MQACPASACICMSACVNCIGGNPWHPIHKACMHSRRPAPAHAPRPHHASAAASSGPASGAWAGHPKRQAFARQHHALTHSLQPQVLQPAGPINWSMEEAELTEAISSGTWPELPIDPKQSLHPPTAKPEGAYAAWSKSDAKWLLATTNAVRGHSVFISFMMA